MDNARHMNSRIALIVDSTTDLPHDFLKQHAIDVVPIRLIWGKEELRDQIDISSQVFYDRLTSDPIHPTTSLPSPQDFVDAIEAAKERDAEEVIILTISSGLSGTHNAACIGADMVDIPVTVIDSKANSLSFGWQVMTAVRVRDAGGSVKDIQSATARVLQNTVTMLYVDTLEYLHRGGRISGISKFVGSILSIKPLVRVNHRTGQMEPVSRVRTRKQGLRALYRMFFEELDTSQPLHIGVIHGDNLAVAEEIASRIKTEYDPAELMIRMTAPVMGVHTGPGAIGLCGYAGE